MKIIPGLPNPSSRRVYRLQVGAFSAPEAADRVLTYVKSNGFNVERECTGSVYRVIVTGIPAANVRAACVRLGSLGFSQVWVRE
jgi:cell division protein FtsN